MYKLFCQTTADYLAFIMKQTNPLQPEHSSYPCFSLYDGDKQKRTQVSEASLGEPMVSAGLQED